MDHKGQHQWVLWSSVWLRISTVTPTWRALHYPVSVSAQIKEIFTELQSRFGSSLSNLVNIASVSQWVGSRLPWDFLHANIYEQITTIKSDPAVMLLVLFLAFMFYDRNKTDRPNPSDWTILTVRWGGEAEADQGEEKADEGGERGGERRLWVIAGRWFAVSLVSRSGLGLRLVRTSDDLSLIICWLEGSHDPDWYSSDLAQIQLR